MNETTSEYKGYVGSIEVNLEDRCLHGKILFINDLITYEGETVAELNAKFIESVDRYLDYCKRTDRPADKACSGSFNIRIGPELHRKAMVFARVKNKSLNDFIKEAVQSAVHEKTNRKVEHVHQHFITNMQPKSYTMETQAESTITQIVAVDKNEQNGLENYRGKKCN